MRRVAVLAASLFVVSAAAYAESTYRMVSGGWWKNVPHCQGSLDVEYSGTDKLGTLRWREGAMDSWKVGKVKDVAPEFNRFFIGSVDQTTSVQGTIDDQRIEGSVTFYQRMCEYRFVLQRL
jgi:hypothetical protein